MAKTKVDHTEEKIEGIEHALSRTERYIEENQKSLTIIVLAISVIVVGFTLYKRYIVGPAEIEAQSQMYVAEQYFAADSFNLALYGDGNNLGFIDIIDEYGITKSANLSSYYAGISFLHLGEFDNAIEYLKDFDSGDQTVQSIATGAMGDAYLELGNNKDALSMYLKAAKQRKNEFSSPIYYMKAAQLHESNGEFKKALGLYENIKKEYPNSSEAQDIDKFIARAKIELE
ncbi:MAG: tetratricopeptide repeat protein [Bacteroidota bacterium]|nr:tetratricopeptide repeat protein [Bacteroidota bacterium]